MNKSRTLSAAFLVSLALAACSSEQKPAELPSTDAAYSEAMDKARGVETTLQQQKDNIDRTLQQNENPTAE
jgi:hypothetical protein